MSLADYIPAEFLPLFSHPDFAKALDGYFTYRVKEDHEYRESIKEIVKEEYKTPEFKTAVDNTLLTSELKTVKRISQLEDVTGLVDYSDFEEEEREPNLPEKINLLEEKIQNIEYRPTIRVDVEIKNPETKTEERAFLLVEELKASGKEYFSSHEIISFLKSKLPDTCRIDEKVQNIHKVKSDVLKKAENMFNDVFMNKKKTGHREVRLILKPDITSTNLC